MDKSPSPLETLRQLKEMLDAGALTPTEFEALKQQLVLTPAAVPPIPAPPTEPPPAAAPPSPAFNFNNVPVDEAPPVAFSLSSPQSAHTPDVPEALAPLATPPVTPPSPVTPTPTFPYTPSFPAESSAPAAPLASNTPPVSAEPLFSAARPVPPTLPDSAAPLFPPTPPVSDTPVGGWATTELPEEVASSSRNPLSLILSIGGLLALLGLVLYLSLNRQPSEHISSTSQTAADSVATPIETGPQVERLPPVATVPETVRVAPAHPVAPLPARPAPAPDSAASTAPALSPDSTGMF